MELKTFLKRLLKIVDIEKKKYIVNQIKCFSFLMIYTIASVIFPSFLSKIVDLGVVMGDVSNIVLYTTEMLICGILMVIFYYLQKVFFFKFGNDIVLRTKQKLYKKLNTVDIQFWNQYKVGDVLTILDNDIEKLQELLTSDISELVVNICLCIGISSYIIILKYTDKSVAAIIPTYRRKNNIKWYRYFGVCFERIQKYDICSKPGDLSVQFIYQG